jgi:acetyl esterase/lipase
MNRGMPRRKALPGWAALVERGIDRLGFFAANAPATFGAYARQVNAAYGNDPQHRLDVYTPLGRARKPSPVIVFWHGGRWMFGDKADYRFVGAALAALGCVAVLPNYRHYPQVKMSGFMDDAAQAALWAVAHTCDLGGDLQRVYLMGHSAGAHMAALLSLDPRFFAAAGQRVPRIAGVIGLSGPYDFLPLDSAVDQDMFGPPADYSLSQPINFVRSGAPPMLLVHGLDDETVRPKNSRNLAAALRACGVPVALKLYPEVSHAGTVAALAALARRRAPTLADIAAFLEAHQAARAAAAADMA